MSMISRIPGPDNLHVGGLWAFNLDSHRKRLFELNITHVLSVIEFSFIKWGEEARRFTHLSIDIDDDEDADLLVHFSKAVRFIDSGLYPSSGSANQHHHHHSEGTPGSDGVDGEQSSTLSLPGGVYVHCAMGKSRSVSCVIAYLLYKYPHRFGGKQFTPSHASTLERRSSAADAVHRALQCVRESRSMAYPNDGFMRQLEMWWEFGCPADDDNAIERHPAYQKWLYDRMLKDARNMRVAPETEYIRFEDEVDTGSGGEEAAAADQAKEGKEVRCKKCRRVLATPKFLISHTPTAQSESPKCAHIFIDTLSWMRPALEDGVLDGRLVCPNTKCGAVVGRFAWQGLKCSCQEWVVPAFSLNRSRVDEVMPRVNPHPAARPLPGRAGSL
ncbi:protein-tyrosine phosphatase-like protein [Biscogniauxia mediterranea]|nr:protein-tyrosine phosphatase-like protein [Biscogniauxia mediterranea]